MKYVYCEDEMKKELIDSSDIVVIFENIRCVVDAETEIVLGKSPVCISQLNSHLSIKHTRAKRNGGTVKPVPPLCFSAVKVLLVCRLLHAVFLHKAQEW